MRPAEWTYITGNWLSVLGMIRTSRRSWFYGWHGSPPGRPPSERAVLARAFIAKAVFNIPTTSLLIEMLSADKTLRRLCGWQRAGEVPESSRRFRGLSRSSPRALCHRGCTRR